jgi:nitrous oxide reductase accessory protein NosL
MPQQQLLLKDELGEHFLFCQTLETANGVALAPQLQLSSNSVRYRMKIGGQIAGFAQVTKPYVLRDGAAKALNESRKY